MFDNSEPKTHNWRNNFHKSTWRVGATLGGDYLGELTNELDDEDHIATFVSGGQKNYAYQTKMERRSAKYVALP